MRCYLCHLFYWKTLNEIQKNADEKMLLQWWCPLSSSVPFLIPAMHATIEPKDLVVLPIVIWRSWQVKQKSPELLHYNFLCQKCCCVVGKVHLLFCFLLLCCNNAMEAVEYKVDSFGKSLFLLLYHCCYCHLVAVVIAIFFQRRHEDIWCLECCLYLFLPHCQNNNSKAVIILIFFLQKNENPHWRPSPPSTSNSHYLIRCQ